MSRFLLRRMLLCRRLPHPFVYLLLLLAVVTAANVFVYVRFGGGPDSGLGGRAGRLRQVSVVRLIEDSELTVLSRIQYPDRSTALIYGSDGEEEPQQQHDKNNNSSSSSSRRRRKPVLTIGIASTSRPHRSRNNSNSNSSSLYYVTRTLDSLLSHTDEEERRIVTVVICLTDADAKVRRARAEELYGRYQETVDSGLVQLVAPPSNIYPTALLTNASHGEGGGGATYGDGPNVARWRSKLALDFAFLMAYAEGLPARYYLNLEDDVEPTEPHFVRAALQFASDVERTHPEWVSLSLSRHLSIGRLYRTQTLPRLVPFILTSYLSQPVDFLMHYFDALQLADGFRPDAFRRGRPLFRHFGDVSTKETFARMDREAKGSGGGKKKKKKTKTNPSANLYTNLSPWKRKMRLEDAYRKSPPSAFRGRMSFDEGGMGRVDVVFARGPVRVRRFVAVTGVDRGSPTSASASVSASSERVLRASLLGSTRFVGVSPDGMSAECEEMVMLADAAEASRGGRIEMEMKGKSDRRRWACLRMVVLAAEGEWVTIRRLEVEMVEKEEEREEESRTTPGTAAKEDGRSPVMRASPPDLKTSSTLLSLQQ